MFRMIGTWRMCLNGMRRAVTVKRDGGSVTDAVIEAISAVESEPSYTSVGYGGLPALDGHVYLDSSYMDGDRLRYGCIISAESIESPIRAARALCGREYNCVLAGRGAEAFAVSAGLPMRDMRTAESQRQWKEALQTRTEQAPLDAYRDHDTVCVLGLEENGSMLSGTSTSGLFMKEPGRVGDSPIIGSGFYCDSRYGAAAATGLGEDIMRGCLSYEIVARMRDGATAQQAAEGALKALTDRKLELGEDAGSISLIALSAKGDFGAATTLSVFPFTVGDEEGARLYAARPNADGTMRIDRATEEQLEGEP